MAQADIPVRQNIIREWWRQNRTTRAMLAYQAASWSEPVHIERWTDMQARIACFEHGTILGDQAFWTLISLQLEYPALWVAKNWHLTAVKRMSRDMETTYHRLARTSKGRIILSPVTLFTAQIQTSDAALYEWLGITGGHLETDNLNLLKSSSS